MAMFPAAAPQATRRLRVCLTITFVALLAAGAFAVAGSGERVVAGDHRPAAIPDRESGIVPIGSSGYLTRDGSAPESPATRLQLGPAVLEQPLAAVEAGLGGSHLTAPDLGGTNHAWILEGGAQFSVTVIDEEATHPVIGVTAEVPAGSPVRVAMFGGVVVGATPLVEVPARWGPPEAVRTLDTDDFEYRYIECVGPFPVVVKFDSVPGHASEALVARALVAYADAPPGSAGCGDAMPV